jgi:hypothetical protein
VVWGVPLKTHKITFLLILAQFSARLYQPCEPRMAQTQKPAKLKKSVRLLYAPSAT